MILNQRYLRRAKRLEKIADDKSVDAEIRIQAEIEAAEFERAVHDMSYHAPSYLIMQGLIPDPKKNVPCLSATKIKTEEGYEERDPGEDVRMVLAGLIRMQNNVERVLRNYQQPNKK
jgi:hypothetical protein